jgi:2'-5' RNA ligase
MAYLVLAYPELEKFDFEWIQDYRKKNDPLYYTVVDPHITLVFALEVLNRDDFVEEVKKQIKDFNAFDATFNVATINQDHSGKYFHEFLVPDTGYSNIVKLHDRLYADKFANSLRLDIDYIPHIGIGNSEVAQQSKQRVDEINARDISIKGRVASIDIVEHRDGIIRTIDKVVF